MFVLAGFHQPPESSKEFSPQLVDFRTGKLAAFAVRLPPFARPAMRARPRGGLGGGARPRRRRREPRPEDSCPAKGRDSAIEGGALAPLTEKGCGASGQPDRSMTACTECAYACMSAIGLGRALITLCPSNTKPRHPGHPRRSLLALVVS